MDPLEILCNDGVDYVTRQGWVDWRDIEDTELSLSYHHVVYAYEKYEKAVQALETKLAGRTGDE